MLSSAAARNDVLYDRRFSMSVSGPVTPSASSVATALKALCAAGESGDADAIAELLAPDVVFHSPMTDRIRFEGSDEVVALHRDIFAVLDDINTTQPLGLRHPGAFVFSARVRRADLEA